MTPQKMPASTKHATLNAQEAALVSGELIEPTWKSPNELIHERVNFDDTIWGFGLAGGVHYQTPMRVLYVKPKSRAQKVHIYPGDIVLKINGVDSSKLTLEEAHQMIVDAGIHLILNVTAPEDKEDSYHIYQDPLVEDIKEGDEEKEAIKEESPKIKKPFSKSTHWCLQWPWKCRRKIIWKESNCYLVPSKYEEKHSDHRKPEAKTDDSIVLDSIFSDKGKKNATGAKETSNNVENDNLQDVNEETESNVFTEKDSNENEYIDQIHEKSKLNGSVDNDKAEEQNLEDVNDGSESNGPVDKDNDAYFDKFENENIPEISISEKLITNGR